MIVGVHTAEGTRKPSNAREPVAPSTGPVSLIISCCPKAHGVRSSRCYASHERSQADRSGCAERLLVPVLPVSDPFRPRVIVLPGAPVSGFHDSSVQWACEAGEHDVSLVCDLVRSRPPRRSGTAPVRPGERLGYYFAARHRPGLWQPACCGAGTSPSRGLVWVTADAVVHRSAAVRAGCGMTARYVP